MNNEVIRKYRDYRRRNPRTPARYALSYAKMVDASGKWEEDHDNHWTMEQDGLTIKLWVEDESIYPVPNRHGDTDYGKYVDAVRREYSYEWDGNYPQPEELAEFRLVEETPSGKRIRNIIFPYTSIHYSGPGWVQGEEPGYFIPSGVQDEYEAHRRHGASRSVAWDWTREFIESQLTMLFSSPLTNCVVHVEAWSEDIELASSCTGTDVSGDDEGRAYIFEMADECGMITEVIADAKAEIERLAKLA
jgi:hypothetical protein